MSISVFETSGSTNARFPKISHSIFLRNYGQRPKRISIQITTYVGESLMEVKYAVHQTSIVRPFFAGALFRLHSSRQVKKKGLSMNIALLRMTHEDKIRSSG